jgi:hypothetical protein
MENIIQENVQLRNLVSKQQTTIARLETENAELKKVVTKATTMYANSVRDKILKESGLPEPSVERIRKAFPGTDLGGLKQAINTERKLAGVQ